LYLQTGRIADGTTDVRSRDRTETGATGNSAPVLDSGLPSPSSPSLSSWPKTSARKRVRFADDAGLALATVFDAPSPTEAVSAERPAVRRRLRLEAWFRQPWLDPVGLRGRVARDRVALQSASGRGDAVRFSGTVVVANVAFEKRVTVRTTFDCWQSYVDSPARYIASASAIADMFSFDVIVPDLSSRVRVGGPPRLGSDGGRSLEFAVRYQYRSHGEEAWTECWDNNGGQNYRMLTMLTTW